MATQSRELGLERLMTLEEAMAYLRVSRSTLLRLMCSKKLTGHKVGGTWRFYVSDVQNCVEKGEEE